MDLETFAEVLSRFPQSSKTAKSVRDIAEHWPFGKTPPARIRDVYRCVQELSSGIPPIGDFVCKIPKSTDASRGDAVKVYLDLNEIANFFMSDGIALQLLLGRRSINPALAAAAAIESDTVDQIVHARLSAGKSSASTLANKIRVIPDGFNRMLAKIDPDVLRVMIEALVRKRWVEFDYRSSGGKKSHKKCGPLSLCVKDGTIYLICLEGVKSTPGAPLPLHRMSNAQLRTDVFHHARFEVDEWLEKTGQLNHPQGDIDQTITLELLVAPISIWHFQERPLGPDQKIIDPTEPGGWYRLTVTTKLWYTLIAFLAGFGPYIKVLGPTEVLEGKDGIVEWARGMAKLYD